MAWSHWIVDTQTGVKQLQVTPATGSFSRALNGPGNGGSHSFKLAASKLTQAQWDALTATWSRTLVTSWNGVACYAGVIVDADGDRDTQTVTISHVDVRIILSHRFPFGATSYWSNPPTNTIPGSLIATGLEYRGIASRVMSASLTGLFPSAAALPIILPPAVAGAQSRPYFNYNFQTTDAILTELSSAQGGPDFDFEPSWSNNALVWTLRAGTDAVPALGGNAFEFNLSGAKPALFNVKRRRNGQKQVSGVFSIGAGQEVDMRVAGVGLGAASPFPALDVTASYKLIDDLPTLAGHSQAQLAVQQNPTIQWAASVMADAAELRGLPLQLGSKLSVFSKGDLIIPDGWSVLRLIGYSADLTNKLTLQVQ